MERALAIELANAAAALDQTLTAIHLMLDRNEKGEPLRAALRHAREILNVVGTLVARVDDALIATGARIMFKRLSVELEMLERNFGGDPLH